MMDWEYGAAPEPSAAAQVQPTYSPVVDGAVVDATGEAATAWNPTLDAPLAQVHGAGAAEVERAVAAARRAQPGWATRPGAERTRILARLARVVAARAAELSVLETLGTGRLVALTRDVDLPATVAHLRSCAGWADKLEHAGYATPRARGVCGATVAGGPPLLTAVQCVAPALACGNAVVLVPDPDAPLTALVFAGVAAEAGLPPGLLSVLPGAVLAGHDGLDALMPVVGAGAGRGVHVVHDDAPLDQAVDGIVETLGTDRRVLVAESVADELGELLEARITGLRVGDPLDRNTDVGPVASRQRRDRALALLGADDGGRRVASPAALPDRGLYLAPTLVTGVAPTSALATDELTGPVVPVLTFRTPAEAVALAGAVRTAAVWTDKGSRALWTAQRLRAAVVWVNAVDRWDPALPAAALGAHLAP